MNTNTSPINFTLFNEDEISEVTQEVLMIITRKILRARDYIRTNWHQLNHENRHKASLAKQIFFDSWVSTYVENIEEQPMGEYPRDLTERLLLALYHAIPPVDRYTDPFSLIPQSF